MITHEKKWRKKPRRFITSSIVLDTFLPFLYAKKKKKATTITTRTHMTSLMKLRNVTGRQVVK